jgi:DNA-binding beta-propeller fold protein YncE
VTLVIVDTATQTVQKEVPLAGMTDQYGVVGVSGLEIMPDGSRAFVCYDQPGPLIQVDLISGQESSLPIACRTGRGLALSADARELFVDSAAGQVSVLDADTGSLVRQVPVPIRTTRIFPTPSGKLIVMGDSESQIGKGAISVVDAKTGSAITSIEVEPSIWFSVAPYGAELSPDGRQLYWAHLTTVHVVDITEA